MTAIVTDKFRFANAREAKRRLDAGDDLYYLAVGRSEDWTNESVPPTPDVDYADDLTARHSIQGIKKIVDTVYCAPRYNWTSGDTYVAYDDADPDLHTKKYYVLNQSNFNVYMCLKAGSGTSTVEPVGVDDGGSGQQADRGSVLPTAGADGYVWKFMYTVSAVQAQKYLTNDFLPVFRDDDVASNATQGAIHDIQIDSAGVGYDSAPTIAIEGDGSGATATCTVSGGVINSITITAVGSGYTYARAVLTGGTPETEAVLRPVVAPLAVGRELNAIVVDSGGTSYTNGSIAMTISGDGFSAAATATVSGGIVQSVALDSGGAGYNYTEASAAMSITTAGDTASFTVNFSGAKGGFGYDPIVDMNAYHLMHNIVLEGDENPTEGFNGDFITGNNYRQLMIIKNPLTLASPPVAFTDSTGMGLQYHTVDAGGTWNLDETITGGTSGAKAIVDYYDSANERVYYHQTADTGWDSFSSAEALTGSSGGSGAIATAGQNNAAEFDKFTGTMTYLENRVAVSRAPTQTEDIKLVVQY